MREVGLGPACPGGSGRAHVGRARTIAPADADAYPSVEIVGRRISSPHAAVSTSAIIDRLRADLFDRYRVERELGEGGMATVFLVQDLKHDRSVALKVLKPELAAVLGADRFLKEIQVTAKLQHPNILPLFDSGEVDGLLYYVMPYVQGESLRARLDRERELPVGEAVTIAREVAGALDYAHRNDVVHRDIKPGNILLQDGRALVADFGIALAVQVAGGERATEEGVYIGTPEYMSPEQASGDRAVDARSDVYSLGAVLYEMLAGEPPHTGPTVQAVLAKVLTERPVPLTDLRSTVPHPVVKVVERALARLPADRHQSAAELARALDTGAGDRPRLPEAGRAPPTGEAAGATSRSGVGRRWPLALAGLTLLLAGLWLGRVLPAPQASSPDGPSRFVIELPEGWAVAPEDLRAVAISPDGRQIALVASDGRSKRLFVRELAGLHARPLPGTEGAVGPFFSPDGDWIGFFADGRLKKVATSGGPPVSLADAALARGAAWGPDGTMLFTSAPGTGLWQVPAAGGEQSPLTALDLAGDERTHRFPSFMPGGRRVHFTIRRGTQPTFADAHVALLDLDNGTHRVVLGGGTQPIPLPTGQLLFARGDVIQAVPIDDDGRPAGDPVAVLDDVMFDPSTGATQYHVSETGTLVYLEGGAWAARRRIHLRGPGGDRVVIDEPGAYRSPRLAPDGRRVAVVVEGANDDIWIHDLEAGTARRLTFAAGSNIAPVWSPDGGTLIFASNRQGRYNLYRKDASGGAASRVTTSTSIQFPGSWHPTGEVVAFTEVAEGSGSDIRVVAADGTRPAEPFSAQSYNEYGPAFSPDGRWLAYTSDESGQDEIYLQPYPATGEKEQVSVDGGVQPQWSPDGRTLYYRRDSRILAVTIGAGATPSVSSARPVVEGDFATGNINPVAPYDVHPDGTGLLVAGADQSRPPRAIHVVLDWFTELEALR